MAIRCVNDWVYFCFFVLVTMFVVIILFDSNQLTIANIRYYLKNYKIYLTTFIILILLSPLNQTGMKIPVVNYITLPTTFLSIFTGLIGNTVFVIVYFIFLIILLKFRYMLYYLIVKRFSIKRAAYKSWSQDTGYTIENIFFLVKFPFQLIIAIISVSTLQYFIDMLQNIIISILTANILMSFLTGVLNRRNNFNFFG